MKAAVNITNARPLDGRTFVAISAYIAVMLVCTLTPLLGEGTATSHFAAFDDLYYLVVVVQAFFGIFILPYAIASVDDCRIVFVNLALVFAAGAPSVAVSAFSSTALWDKMLLSQMLVFSLWLLSCWLGHALRSPARSGFLYIPLVAVPFFGVSLLGNALSTFSGTGRTAAGFSIPAVLGSWVEGDYFGIGGWLGAVVCFASFAVWSRKLAVSRNR